MTDATYWNRGVGMVPIMTGAATLMDGADIREHAERLGFDLPFASVLDVGCGTGRLAQFTHGDTPGAHSYIGCDIAADAVTYCRRAGLLAFVIAGPGDLPQSMRPATPAFGELEWVVLYGEERHRFDWVACLSVFTHIDQPARVAYLRAFEPLSPNLLVDIIPGDGQGDVALWTADPAGFEQDLADTGWLVQASYDRPCHSGPTHRYYRCRRRQTESHP